MAQVSQMSQMQSASSIAGVSRLISESSVKSPKPFSQTNWDELPKWCKTVLGDGCDVAYQQLNIEGSSVKAMWHMTGVNGADLVVQVGVETRVDEDGKLDFEASSRAAVDSLTAELTNTSMGLGPNYENINSLWTPAKLVEHGQCSVQHAANLPEGRILIASGNTMIDMRGGASSAALEQLARSILAHTTVDDISRRHIPHVIRHTFEIPKAQRGDSDNVVKGTGTTFNIVCEMDSLIVDASAEVEGFGLLLSERRIEDDKTKKTSTITFVFMTRKTGTHDIDLRFAKASTLILGTERVQVTVV